MLYFLTKNLMATFQIFTDTARQYRFHLRATGNNEIILASEGYKEKYGCKNGIESVKKNSIDSKNYGYWQNKGRGHFWFTIIGDNGEPIGTSEMYTTLEAMHH